MRIKFEYNREKPDSARLYDMDSGESLPLVQRVTFDLNAKDTVPRMTIELIPSEILIEGIEPALRKMVLPIERDVPEVQPGNSFEVAPSEPGTPILPETWVQIWGDPSDPEVAAKIAAAAEALAARANQRPVTIANCLVLESSSRPPTGN